MGTDPSSVIADMTGPLEVVAASYSGTPDAETLAEHDVVFGPIGRSPYELFVGIDDTRVTLHQPGNDSNRAGRYLSDLLEQHPRLAKGLTLTGFSPEELAYLMLTTNFAIAPPPKGALTENALQDFVRSYGPR